MATTPTPNPQASAPTPGAGASASPMNAIGTTLGKVIQQILAPMAQQNVSIQEPLKEAMMALVKAIQMSQQAQTQQPPQPQAPPQA